MKKIKSKEVFTLGKAFGYIGFTGIGPMLSFASLNSSKSVASGFTLHKTRGVSCCGLAIHIKKYLKGKEELWKLKYFTMQKYNLQKIL